MLRPRPPGRGSGQAPWPGREPGKIPGQTARWPRPCFTAHLLCPCMDLLLLMLTEACSVTHKCIFLFVQIRQLRPQGTQTEDRCGGPPSRVVSSSRASQRGPRSVLAVLRPGSSSPAGRGSTSHVEEESLLWGCGEKRNPAYSWWEQKLV